MIRKVRWAGLLLLLVPIWPKATIAAQLYVTWTDNSYNEAGFQIERKPETDDTFTPIVTVGQNITTYVDTAVESGITYCYQVSAFNADGISTPSNIACSQAQ